MDSFKYKATKVENDYAYFEQTSSDTPCMGMLVIPSLEDPLPLSFSYYKGDLPINTWDVYLVYKLPSPPDSYGQEEATSSNLRSTTDSSSESSAAGARRGIQSDSEQSVSSDSGVVPETIGGFDPTVPTEPGAVQWGNRNPQSKSQSSTRRRSID
jgi:hypothetical protein